MRYWISLWMLAAGMAYADAPQVFSGNAPDAGEFFNIPFSVPVGTQRIEIEHLNLNSDNILDWGLEDPSGHFRGWGGGNKENVVVEAKYTSRSYLLGAMEPGTWKVIVGKAKIESDPSAYKVTITNTAGTIEPAQTMRQTYVEVPALKTGSRWYAGDFHVHSKESGDADPTLDAIAEYAKGRGLDFVALSDHNTSSQLDFINDTQTRFPDLLLVPSVEFTTYHGHLGAFGTTTYVDHRIGFNGQTLPKALRALAEQGAFLAINHPDVRLGPRCIGCAWDYPILDGGVGGLEAIGSDGGVIENADQAVMHGVEVGISGWNQVGQIYTPGAIAFFEDVVQHGMNVVPIGGSDDHGAGLGDRMIGNPTTYVYATELSVTALLKGLFDGLTVVKLDSPNDPMIELASADTPGVPPEKATLGALPQKDGSYTTTLQARVSGGNGQKFRWVVNGVTRAKQVINTDPFVANFSEKVPLVDNGISARVRAEVLVNDQPRTITSYIRITTSPVPAKSGCTTSGWTVFAIPMVLVGFLLLRKRMPLS